jgi:uncharacterized protein
MKASKFNTFTEFEDGSILAHNGVKGSLVKFDRETYDMYLKLVSEDAGERPDPDDPVIAALVEDLARGGFLVDDKLDEIDYLKVFFSRSKYSPQKFSLTIAVTTACNFRCAYCFESGIEPQSMSRDVEDKLIAYVERKLAEKDSFYVTWYGGEPLLALDTIYRLSDAFIEIAAQKKADYSSGIVTNGYLLDKETAAELRKRKVMITQITIDGDKEEHDKNRPLANGGGTFDTIVGNIREAAGTIPITVRVNLGKHNIEAYARLLDEFDRAGISNKIVSIVPSLLDVFDFSPQSVKDAQLNAEEFSRVSLELTKMTFDRGINVSISDSDNPHMYCTSVTQDRYLVGPDGSLYKCWDVLGRKDEVVGRIGQDVKLKDGSIKWLAWDCFGNEECRNCKILPLCLGGCPRKSVLEDSTSFANSRCSKLRYNLDEWLKLLYRQQMKIRGARPA